MIFRFDAWKNDYVDIIWSILCEKKWKTRVRRLVKGHLKWAIHQNLEISKFKLTFFSRSRSISHFWKSIFDKNVKMGNYTLKMISIENWSVECLLEGAQILLQRYGTFFSLMSVVVVVVVAILFWIICIHRKWQEIQKNKWIESKIKCAMSSNKKKQIDKRQPFELERLLPGGKVSE